VLRQLRGSGVLGNPPLADFVNQDLGKEL